MITFRSISCSEIAGRLCNIPSSSPSLSPSVAICLLLIVRLLLKEPIRNAKEEPENLRTYECGVAPLFLRPEVLASFTQIFCPINKRPSRSRDVCVQCLVLLTKCSVKANPTK